MVKHHHLLYESKLNQLKITINYFPLTINYAHQK